MLQMSLCPAAVPGEKVGERRRAPLVRAADARPEPDPPPRANEQCRLDKIVTEDVASERLPGKSGSPAEDAKASVLMIALWPQ